MSEKLQGSIILTILKATNLANKDTFGFSDPYVLIKAISQLDQRPLLEIKTKVKEDDLNPVWNERFSIIIDEEIPCVKLDLEVFDQDSVGNDEPLGYIDVEVNAGFKFNVDIDRDLKPRTKEEVKGKLFFKLEYRKGQQVRLNDALPPKKEEKSFKELPNEMRQNLREWRASKDVLTADEEAKLKLLRDIYSRNFGSPTPVFEVTPHKFGGFMFEYQKANWVVGNDDILSTKWKSKMQDRDGAFINEAKDIVEAVCSFQTAKKSAYRDGYMNDPEGLYCEEIKNWASSELSLLSFGKDTITYLDKRISYLEECLLVPDLFDSTSSLSKETIQMMIVKVRRILKYRAYAAVEKELAHEDATRSFGDLKKHLAGLVRACAQFLKNVFKCETPAEVLSNADKLLMCVEADGNIRQVMGDQLKTTMEAIQGYNTDTFEGPWTTLDLRENSIHPTLKFLDPVTLDPKDPILTCIFKGLHSGVEEFFRTNAYIAYHFLRAHGLLLEAGRLFVVIEKAANCAKTGGTLLVFGLANAQLNATLDSTKAIMELLKEEFNTVSKIAECCFEELVFKNQATKERTAWIKYFKNVFPGINEINSVIEKINEEVSEIKETANSMTLYERFQQAADENKEFLNTADEFSERMAKVTGKPYTKPKPKEMTDEDTKAMMSLINPGS